jgi:hypothetical protein
MKLFTSNYLKVIQKYIIKLSSKLILGGDVLEKPFYRNNIPMLRGINIDYLRIFNFEYILKHFISVHNFKTTSKSLNIKIFSWRKKHEL